MRYIFLVVGILFATTLSARVVAISNDATLLAVSTNESVQIYKIAAQEKVAEIKKHEQGVTQLKFSSDDKFLAISSEYSGELVIINTTTAEVVYEHVFEFLTGVLHFKNMENIIIIVTNQVERNKWVKEYYLVDGISNSNSMILKNGYLIITKIVGEQIHYVTSNGTYGILDQTSNKIVKKYSLTGTKRPVVYENFTVFLRKQYNKQNSTYSLARYQIKEGEIVKKTYKNIPVGDITFLSKDTICFHGYTKISFTNSEMVAYDDLEVKKLPKKIGELVFGSAEQLIYFNESKSYLSILDIKTGEWSKLKFKFPKELDIPYKLKLKYESPSCRYYILLFEKDKNVISTPVIACKTSLKFSENNWNNAYDGKTKVILRVADSPEAVQKLAKNYIYNQYPSSKGYKYGIGKWTNARYRCKDRCK